ncbi:complex I 51 kDa subunit family protein [Halanaerobacter jeridensis]|uniref:NADH-quinone oxidoreductase subunit F n=1 Tax=Halanaerobacter jeridensis TaxID=706427 RepID=A0A939BP32_9FIRM|nr:NADH-ubiquinone oxidoreductase-F iron-sulfur binding region domain-containing protein [Halanaerobacter jeridensis]MBM7556208.1 NADH-quinone oxidoreductase subunit F [Halanaerobacter jeridensis]
MLNFLKKDPILAIEDYDFTAFKQVLNTPAENIISDIKTADLKGRGGAGFPAGVKWELARKEKSAEKYVVCNADEGEPGTFKDRYLLENSPWQVLEGILISAYVIGAEKGYIYIRGEYVKPIKIFNKIIEKAEKKGLLGENILGSEFDFELELIRGAGAYICGDETSLLNSIEGQRPRSRIKPPYPIQSGLYGKPTLVNNVETLAAAVEIINQGVETYTALGTAESNGTKLISLSGEVNEPGVYEIEFGSLTIREIVEQLGKGIRNNGQLKFVVPGGVSTSILPQEKLDIPYSYEDIKAAGSNTGSGAMIVVSEENDLIDLMLNVAEFFMSETCGTCFPCREGIRQVCYLLENAKERGYLTQRDFELITDLSQTTYLAARCGLGQSSLNFVTSVLEHYRDELLQGGGQ